MKLTTVQLAKISLLLFCLITTSNSAVAENKKTVEFSRDIKPLLSDRCFQCHGPDAKQRKADLRLDIADEAIGHAIEPGKPDASELIERISSSDPKVHMPPAESNKPPLTPAEIEIFKKWIEQGADYEGHWAYQPPVRKEVPKIEAADGTGEIDQFIIQRLQQQGLKLSPEADRRTLIRRLFFDLTGLPPKPEEIQAFINDQSVDAYEKLVDNLLQHESYGERMAMYWLDLVRYADTNGIHGDNHRDHAPYRDYVIDAFNQNMPFDQFTREQIAGDLIPDRTNSQWIASGYNRLNMTTREGGAQAKEYLAKYSADRVRNASVVWLGSTLGCAECHDHKYDPFKTKDFYSFAAFFSDVEEVAVGEQQPVLLPTRFQEEAIARLRAEIVATEQELQEKLAASTEEQAKWEADIRGKLEQLRPLWNVVIPEKSETSGSMLAVQDDKSLKSTGEHPKQDTYTLTLKSPIEKISGIRLEALTDESFPNKSLSRANGNFVLSRFEMEVDGQPIKFASAVADFEQQGFPIANAIDGKSDTGWAVSGHEKAVNHVAVFRLAEPLSVKPESLVTVRLRHESIYDGHNIGRFRVALTDIANPGLESNGELTQETFSALQKPLADRTDQEKKLVTDYFQAISPALQPLRDKLNQFRAQQAEQEKSFAKILVTKSTTPRMMRVLPRGNWLDDSGEEVKPAVPSFLNQIQTDKPRADRMDLANWLVDPANPLVARVFVNRLWKICFGQGLVRSMDDFGSQGNVPTHPELLDWLAIDFVANGWDVKRTLKLIVMSEAYRQSSLHSREMRESDPRNLLISHQNRYRLDAEMVRDNALSISGLLVEKVGGPSVKPYQPAGYWKHLNFPTREYEADMNENQYRRGLYSYWCRTFLHPSMLAFDAPSREEACVQRTRSNTPLQALVLLNDPTYVEAARKFAQNIVEQGGDLTQPRIEFAYQHALGRKPMEFEAKVMAGLLEKHLAEYRADPNAAKEILTVGLQKPPENMDLAELAAWTSVARTILNLHETIGRQ